MFQNQFQYVVGHELSNNLVFCRENVLESDRVGIFAGEGDVISIADNTVILVFSHVVCWENRFYFFIILAFVMKIIYHCKSKGT